MHRLRRQTRASNFIWKKFDAYSRFRHSERCRKLLSKAYHGINVFELSIQHRKQENISDAQFTYGEIVYSSFVKILNVVQPEKNEIFYDLGCGGGKAVFSAALLYPGILTRGVECLPPLYNLCQRLQCSIKEMMQNNKFFKDQPLNVKFIAGDLIHIDFSDASIVYLNVTCFNADTWSVICDKLETLSVNARVILTSKQLTSKNFKLIHQQSHVMSWGMNTINIYRKV